LDNPPPIKLLTFSTLYPNAVQPRHGIFVETRLRQLISSGGVTARVMAPVPWFPLRHTLFGSYARYAKIPEAENRHGIDITHPRYPLIPKIGMSLAPFQMALSCLPLLKRQIRQGQNFDIIDAHYFYPDGVAATILGHLLHKPVVITARGSDINVIPQHFLPRKMILWAAEHAAGLITVSLALKSRLISLGVKEKKITVLRNGVDLEIFKPTARDETRRSLGISGPLLLSVGNLVLAKGHDLAINALGQLEGMHLVIIGSGPEKHALQAQAQFLGVAQRVTFLDNVPQNELCRYYSAADMLILASSREGWPNVLLEAMACGTPVIATNVGGVPEIVATSTAGAIISNRTPTDLVAAVKNLVYNAPNREIVRNYAKGFGWNETSHGQKQLFYSILTKE
jgi:glycosyltransferase involved in cell wall biosynthesis